MTRKVWYHGAWVAMAAVIATLVGTGVVGVPGGGSPTPTPTPTETATATPTPTPPAGWPGPDDTGYRNAPGYTGSLTTASSGSSTCPTTFQSNHTYSFCRYPEGADIGSSSAHVTNVECYGCLFKATAPEAALVKVYGDNIRFRYSSFEPGVTEPPVAYNQSYQYGIAANGSYSTSVQELLVEYSDFWGFGNAIDVNGSTCSKPQTFQHNWIHDASDDGGSYHTDGIGSLSGAGNAQCVVIDHNTIESVGNTNGIAFQQGAYSDFTITNNLLGGFGYTVVVWATNGQNVTFQDNTFTTRLPIVFGPLYPQPFWEKTGSSWCRNKWMVPAGAAWGNPAHDEWFWLPATASSGTSSDTPWVSDTDRAC